VARIALSPWQRTAAMNNMEINFHETEEWL